MPNATHRQRTMQTRVIALVGWAALAVYLWPFVGRGWVPVDEGLIGQTALRVLGGQLPHRDFQAVYTGGLAFLNALAFAVGGSRLIVPRIVLYVVTLLWIPALYAISRRFSGPGGAAATVVLAVVWGVPNYFAAVPSWYNMILATFGTLAMFRYIDTGSRRWLVIAGVAGGVSILFKIVGLYYVAAMLLTLAYRDAGRARDDQANDVGRSYLPLATAALALFVLVLCALVRPQLRASEFVHFVFPGALLAGVVVHAEWRAGGRAAHRLPRIARELAWFAIGVIAPVALFALPYALSHSLGALARGVFVLPFRRVGLGVPTPPLFPAALGTMLVAAFVIWWNPRMWIPKRMAIVANVIIAGGLAVVVFQSANDVSFYRATVGSVRALGPAVVLCGAWLLVWEPIPQSLRVDLFLLLALVALFSLVQYPFAAPVYFLYLAPLVALAALAAVSTRPHRSRAAAAIPLAFYVVFGLTRINPGFIYNLGYRYEPYGPLTLLDLPRGGIRVPVADRNGYTWLIAVVHAHDGGQPILALPDAPEVYFLTGSENPTPTLYEAFDDTTGAVDRLLAVATARDVHVVVVNQRPGFSPPLSAAAKAAIARRFPSAEQVGDFTVRWRQ